MFNTISWQSYWIANALTTAAYYIFVYLVYFKGSFKRLSHMDHMQGAPVGELFEVMPPETLPSLFDKEYDKCSAPAGENEEQMVEVWMDELSAFFDNQKKSRAIKSEVMYALHGILQKYPSLRRSAYKDSITNVIAAELENICSIHLSAEELKGVWLG